MAFAVPIFAYEMSLTVWYIVKGLDEGATPAEAEIGRPDYAAQ